MQVLALITTHVSSWMTYILRLSKKLPWVGGGGGEKEEQEGEEEEEEERGRRRHLSPKFERS